MKKTSGGQLVYSPNDLVRYLASPFASWMDRYYLENPEAVAPDETSEEDRLIAETGQKHEREVLKEFRESGQTIVEIDTRELTVASEETRAAIMAMSPLIYQATLHSGLFAGYTDFLMLDQAGP